MTLNDPGFDILQASAEKWATKKTGDGRRIVLTQRKSWFSKVARPNISGLMQHVLFYGGLASVTYAGYMMYRPLGPLVGGLIAVSLGMLLSSDADESRTKGSKSR